jgi:methanogenic corrinoid protein MtbC1
MSTLQMDEFLELLGGADRSKAIDAVLHAYDGGAGIDRLIYDVLAPAQVEVGERWARGEWTVAQEHAATAITDAAIGALATRTDAQPENGPIVLCCAEGDWHSMGGRMATELLRADDWDVVFLGASLPADQLPDYLNEVRPHAVGLSCTVAMYFSGARRCVRAAHSVGVPVVAGGAAFGDTDGRAMALGADAWASDVAGASTVLAGWREQGWPVLRDPSEVTDDGDALDATWMPLRDAALAQMHVDVPAMKTYDERDLSRTLEDLGYIVRFLSGALVVGDDDVYLSFLAWIADHLDTIDGTAGILEASVRAVEAVIPNELSGAHRLIARPPSTGWS